MTNDLDKNPENIGNKSLLGNFSGDKELYMDFVESLMEGDIRPYVIKNYVEEAE